MQQTTEYSILDDNIPVSHDNWVVAICRKPKGKNSEHAFIVVEGKNTHGATVFKRYDFVQHRQNSSQGEVYVKPKIKIGAQEDRKTGFEQEILNNEGIYSLAWSITREQAKKLDAAIRRDKTVNFTYDISGRHSIIAKSKQSSAPDIHSCFTWSQEKLLNLGQETNDGRFAEVLTKDVRDLLISRTSRYISSGEAKDSARCVFM